MFHHLAFILLALCSAPAFGGHVHSWTRYPRPVVVNTWPWTGPNDAAWRQINTPRGTAVDAVVEGCTAAENNRSIPTVGFGGSPDERGNTTLDALVMDGYTMNVGL